MLWSCGQGEPSDDSRGVVVPAGGSLSGEKGQEGQTGRVWGKRGCGRGRLVIPVGAGRIPDPTQQVPAVGECAAEDGALTVEPVGPESLGNGPNPDPARAAGSCARRRRCRP